MTYDLTSGSVDEKRCRTQKVSKQIDQDNEKHEAGGHGKGRMIAFAVLAIIVMIFASNSSAADKVVVGATSSGMAIWEDAPNHDSLRAHYLEVVSVSMEKLTADSLDQKTVTYEVRNMVRQSIFANRLPNPITPYNMVCLFTDDWSLRVKLITLVNNSRWLRQSNAVIILEDNRRFHLVEGQWNYIASAAEIRPVDYNEMICLVMGVDYVAPEPKVVSDIPQITEVVKKPPSGLCTVN
ncbi:MAG: hypothetical protein ACNFW9_03650 [Candidatus Kerfeldbacteria bacterium]